MGERYDAKIKGLFRDMFPEHPFDVLPTVTAEGPLAPVVNARENVPLPTAVLTDSADETVIYLHGNPAKTETLRKFGAAPAAAPTPNILPIPDNFQEIEGSWISTLGAQEYAYTLALFPYAVCLVDNSDSLRKKLSDSAGVLQRYVGSYIAAIIELLLDTYFGENLIPPEGIPVQQTVLNLDWRFSQDKSAFQLIAKQLLTDIGGALPHDHHEFLLDTFANSTSQYFAEGTYVDYAMIKDPKRGTENDFIKSEGTFSCIPGNFKQSYQIKDVFIELKVKSARSHQKRDHYNRAVESVYRHRLPNVVSACFCLSHFRSTESSATKNEASTSTATAFLLRGSQRCYEHRYRQEDETDNAICVLPATYGVKTTFTPGGTVKMTQTAYWVQESGVWIPRYSPKQLAGLCVTDSEVYLFEYVVEDGIIATRDATDGERLYQGKLQRVIVTVDKPQPNMLREGLAINFYTTTNRFDQIGHVYQHNEGAYTDGKYVNGDTLLYAPKTKILYVYKEGKDFDKSPFYPRAVEFKNSAFAWRKGVYFNEDIPNLTITDAKQNPMGFPTTNVSKLAPTLRFVSRTGFITATMDGSVDVTATAKNLLLESDEYTLDNDEDEEA